MKTKIQIPARQAGRRRRFTVQQKRALVAETLRPGESISSVARRYGLAPSMMFQWRRAMEKGGDEGLKSNEKRVPESEVKRLKAPVAELERIVGRKTVDNEILEFAVELAIEKKLISPQALRKLNKLRGGR